MSNIIQPNGGSSMKLRAVVSRYSRGIRRTIAVVLTGVVLSAVALPATTSAQAPSSVHVSVRPSGQSDSPVTP